MKKAVTLNSVAVEAGVSRATASLVLRDSPLVSLETRDRVICAMDKLGYIYNRGAANLRGQKPARSAWCCVTLAACSTAS